MPYEYDTIKQVSPKIDQFLESKANLRKATTQSYYQRLKYYFKISGDELVTEESLKKFLSYIQSTKVAQKTYNNYLISIKIYVNWLKKRNYITDISFMEDYKGYTRPEQVRQKKYYPEDQVRQFLNVKPRWLHYFLFLSFYFAFRPRELSRLETKDIHLDELFIEVRPNVQKVQKLDYLAIPQIFSNKFHELLTWRERQETDNPNLLVNIRGNPINRGALDSHIPKLRKVDPNFRYYYCRYTAAWRAYKNSRDLYFTQQLLRHTSPQKTIIYLGIQRDEVLATQRSILKKVLEGVQL